MHSYTVHVLNTNGLLQLKSFEDNKKPSVAKKAALEQACKYKEEFLNKTEDYFVIRIMCESDAGTFFLDSKGEENTEEVEWFERN